MNTCPNPECKNKSPLPSHWPNKLYSKNGKTNGVQRYMCKECGTTFSDPNPKATSRQHTPEKNNPIFRLLVGGRSIKRICREANVSPGTVYRKIDFFARQSDLFERRKLKEITTDGKVSFCDSIIENGKLVVSVDSNSGYIAALRPTGAAEKTSSQLATDANEKLKKFIDSAQKKLHLYDEFLKNPDRYKIQNIHKIFNIFRIHYNFQVRAIDKKTPAMALGITSEPTDLNEILSLPPF